ncbi:RagB/SusD family nutrient uptake outer membrane protein [Chryseobacterium sp. Y16C]|uniref:RagB/SusD family nutrient uptake outer membrane protein n=1 Tax=Chryseobacterium sp. Y16C TaxID=2920939 RepID=UPI001F0A4DF0|nr:RagB/SusD family nutrient uptake outer membrane protein [Chryseobacterium sp. Y16C]UMQ40247.1 RagB/SusD family nutrient uptake outer membrane protein [Chryseobacterium sp. Y16C]
MKKYITRAALVLLGTFSLVSCGDEFLETNFSNTEEQAPITTIEKLQAFVYGDYATMRDVNYYGNYFVTTSEVRSDEMYSNNRSGYHTTTMNYTMVSSDTQASGAWSAMYTVVAKANTIINTTDNLSWGQSQDPTEISEKVKHLKGQAYALRAQAFFDLLRLFGQKYTQNPAQLGVVLPLEYNPSANMPRASIAQTEAQIEADFDKAYQYLNGNSYNQYGDKTVLNDYSVQALMSRYYLYKGNYAKVRSLVANIVNSAKWSPVNADSFISSFALNNASPNSMFELAVGTSVTIAPSMNDLLSPSGAYKNMPVKTAIYNSYSILPTDVRRAAITTSTAVAGRFIAAKYPSAAGDTNIRMVRYEEVLLNGIEAELNGGSQTTAQGYFTTLLTNRLKDVKDPNGNITQSIAAQITAYGPVDMNKLKAERAKELIGEGFRYWDLLRWGTTITKNTTTGGAGAPATLNLLAFPIPQAETNVAGSLIVSNPGYDN